MFQGKNILIGICGSIAAYKTGLLIRELVKQGASVRVILTEDAGNFITPLTLSTLSKHPVLSTYFDPETGAWNNHVEIANWADLFLIAPITANTIAKLATGLCDNLLTSCYLSYTGPLWIAPAMDLDMWKHPTTVHNLQTLHRCGIHVIEPGYGELASGLVGEGRLADTSTILEALQTSLRISAPKEAKDFKGKKVLVTAGPTYEPIDPVRFIGNRSSGKMGFSIAEYMRDQGAEVTLIAGPCNLKTPTGIKRINIFEAKEMLQECIKHFPNADITIMSAAVADYRSVIVSDQKIKKEVDNLQLNLEKTTDILAQLGKEKRKDQILVGFALETENELLNALNKLKRKNLDLIVLNSLRDPGAGFEKDTNQVTIIHADGSSNQYPQKSKMGVAQDIGQEILKIKLA